MTESELPDAEFYRRFKADIPKGIYYEQSKKRWRVRLYKAGRVVYLGYFKEYPQAVEALRDAKKSQRLAPRTKTDELNLNTDDSKNLLTALNKL